mmetsp:Transcript_11751/g.29040  ORF Transcript_11751/g.29040 Transcript_11751/m.29040 type:complete len:93 (+) Transcript_11751:154-432(+)
MGATLIQPGSCSKILHMLAGETVHAQVDIWVPYLMKNYGLRVGQLCENPRFLQTKDSPSRATFLVDGMPKANSTPAQSVHARKYSERLSVQS